MYSNNVLIIVGEKFRHTVNDCNDDQSIWCEAEQGWVQFLPEKLVNRDFWLSLYIILNLKLHWGKSGKETLNSL